MEVNNKNNIVTITIFIVTTTKISVGVSRILREITT
jgi:hypothetical protein